MSVTPPVRHLITPPQEDELQPQKSLQSSGDNFSQSPPQLVPSLIFPHYSPRLGSAITSSLRKNAEIHTPGKTGVFSNTRKNYKKISHVTLANEKIRGGTQSVSNLSFIVSENRRKPRTAEQLELEILDLTRKTYVFDVESAVKYQSQPAKLITSKSQLLPQSARGADSTSQKFEDPSTLKRMSLETHSLDALLVDSPSFKNLDPAFKVTCSSTPRKIPRSEYGNHFQAMMPCDMKKLQEDLLLYEANKSPTNNGYHCALVRLHNCLTTYNAPPKEAKTEESKKPRGPHIVRAIKNLVKRKSTEVLMRPPEKEDSLTAASHKTKRNTLNLTDSEIKTPPTNRRLSLTKSYRSLNDVLHEIPTSENVRQPIPYKRISEPAKAISETPSIPPISSSPPGTESVEIKEAFTEVNTSRIKLAELRRVTELNEIISLYFIFQPEGFITALNENQIKKLYSLRAIVDDHLLIESKLVIKFPIATQLITMKDLRTIEKFKFVLLNTFNSKKHVLQARIEEFINELCDETIVAYKKEFRDDICAHFKSLVQELVNKSELTKYFDSEVFSSSLEDLFANKTKKLVKDIITPLKPRKLTPNSAQIIFDKILDVFNMTIHYANALLFKNLIYQSIESLLKATNTSVDNNYNCILTDPPDRKKVPFIKILKDFFTLPMHFILLKNNHELKYYYRDLSCKIFFKIRKLETSKIIDEDLINTLLRGTNAATKSVFSVFTEIIGDHRKELILKVFPSYHLIKNLVVFPSPLYESENIELNRLEILHLKFLTTLALKELKDPAKLSEYSVEFISILERYFANKKLQEDPHVISKKLITYIQQDQKNLEKITAIYKLHTQLITFIPISCGDSGQTSPKEKSRLKHSIMAKLLAKPETLYIFDGEKTVNVLERIEKCYEYFTQYHNAIASLEGNRRWKNLIHALPKEKQAQAWTFINNFDYEKFFELYIEVLDARFDMKDGYEHELNILIECYKNIVINILDVISLPGKLNSFELDARLTRLLKIKLNIIFRRMDRKRILWEAFYDLLQSIQTYTKI